MSNGVWEQLNMDNVSMYPSGLFGSECDACGEEYIPIRSSDTMPICDSCKDTFYKFCKSQKKRKLLDHENIK